MPASHESVSDEWLASRPRAGDAVTESVQPAPEPVLIVGANWLGDSIMAMPAVQSYRRANPDTGIAVLVKPKCRDIWSMHPDIDSVLVCRESALDAVRAAAIVRRRRFGTAFVLPHSFRSATVPFLARVPRRFGLPGHGRDWMLTRVVNPEPGPGRVHQCHEYMHLFGLPEIEPGPPALTVPPESLARMREVIGAAGAVRIGIMPGAAYGPSKQWPAEFFAETGRMLSDEFKCAILVLGSKAELELCRRVAEAVGHSAIDLAGRTSLTELAAVLSECAVVISNDSGGMHLAAALGAPVVAIFGITDPDRTGPLGSRVRVLQDSEVRTRDLERESETATDSLRRISPQQAFDAARGFIVA